MELALIKRLKGMRGIASIVCTCGKSWEFRGDKLSAKERRTFIGEHSEHKYGRLEITTRVW